MGGNFSLLQEHHLGIMLTIKELTSLSSLPITIAGQCRHSS